jgi:hypothetical protein
VPVPPVPVELVVPMLPVPVPVPVLAPGQGRVPVTAPGWVWAGEVAGAWLVAGVVATQTAWPGSPALPVVLVVPGQAAAIALAASTAGRITPAAPAAARMRILFCCMMNCTLLK